MPLFDFTCAECGWGFESLVLKPEEPIRCPKCGSDSVSRSDISLFSCTGVNLTKRLTMDSEDRLKKGMAKMQKQRMRRDRIRIL